MLFSEFKAPKGVIKVQLKIEDSEICSIKLTGDFFMYPEEALSKFEDFLQGTEVEEGELRSTVKEFYNSSDIKTPMIGPEHWVKAILGAVGD
ncbi:MAG: lipoate--protein ligase family protein [Hadesarchaea archaeon]|nr:lipoate--protein ligase family protein [Hadesarchaea archaeon]